MQLQDFSEFVASQQDGPPESPLAAKASYKARKMDLAIGRQLVTLEPIGTLLIGSRGRVDVRGAAGQRQLVYVQSTAKSPMDLTQATPNSSKTKPSRPRQRESIRYAWKIVSRDRYATFIDLDKDSLYAVLMEVAGGR